MLNKQTINIIKGALSILKLATNWLRQYDSQGYADEFDKQVFYEYVTTWQTYKELANDEGLSTELQTAMERLGLSAYYGDVSIVDIANDMKAEERMAYSSYALSLI